jgi:hypothetical protein
MEKTFQGKLWTNFSRKNQIINKQSLSKTFRTKTFEHLEQKLQKKILPKNSGKNVSKQNYLENFL